MFYRRGPSKGRGARGNFPPLLSLSTGINALAALLKVEATVYGRKLLQNGSHSKI